MLTDLLEIAIIIKTLYQKLEYLDKIGQKNSLEYKMVVDELIRQRKMEEDLITYNSIYSKQILDLIAELKEKYSFFETELKIVPNNLEIEKQAAIRVMNELIVANLLFLNNYYESLKKWLLVDELIYLLSIAYEDGLNDMVYNISYLVPSIEDVLLKNNFEIRKVILKFSERVKDFYNVHNKYHVMYKDQLLSERFITIVKFVINQSDEEINAKIEYYNFIKYLLQSIITLASDTTRLELKSLVSKYLFKSKCSNKASEILESVINSNDLRRNL